MVSFRLSGAWKRRLTEAFTRRLALKGTAFALAIVLWLIATAKEPTENVVPVRFEPALDSTLALRDPPPAISALVAGRGEDLLKLYSTPLVFRRAIATGVPDTLVVDLSPRDIEVPSELEGHIIVRDVQPRSLMLRFEVTSTRMVPVRSQLLVAASDGAYGVQFEPDSVEVSGPRQVVARIDHVWTVRTTIPADDSLPHLVDIDTTRLQARVRPKQVKARLILNPDLARLPRAIPSPDSSAERP
jgi:YbbR domain-containing protein